MLARLGGFVVGRRVAVLVTAVVLLAVAGMVGGGVPAYLSSGGFDNPDAESSRGAAVLEETFGTGAPNIVLLVEAEGAGVAVDAPDAAAAGAALTEELAAEPGLEQVASYWSLGSPPPLRSTDGAQALVLGRITGDFDEVAEHVGQLSADYTRDGEVIDVSVGGSAEVFRQVGEQIESDLARAELLALPITLLLLVLVFGSVVAASLPLAVGVMAILGTFLILRGLTTVTDVSIFALNLTTALGLGLAIDYALFITSRFREELAGGLEPHAAVIRTVQTAGKTVAFSAATVAISLAALMVFPLMFLRSFAYAGIAVVTFAALGSIVVLPALLAVLGHRVEKWTLFRRKPVVVGAGVWHRIAVTVMRRPVPVATVVIALLVVLGTPFLGITFGQTDDRVLPEAASARVVSDEIREGFRSAEADALSVVVQGCRRDGGSCDGVDPDPEAIGAYAADLSQVDGVARVDALTGSYIDGAQIAPPNPTSARFEAPDATWLSVVQSVEPSSPEGEAVVTDVRAVPVDPFGDAAEISVTGASAQVVDAKAAIFDRVPLATAIVAVVTFTVLFLMFGSLLVPAKAVLLNLLSLTATFGAMVWVFQEGHLSGLLNFTPVGTIDITTPILMFCIAFGLSMDYEVFLLSRIKEEHDHGADTVTSVARGLERTGRIVTAAAILLAVVFIAFATSGITTIKMIGVGMALAVLMDATLIRGTLVPAFMRLAGDANWWAPGPLRRFYERFGISETELEPDREMATT